MKVIFLDIDGVLVNHKSLARAKKENATGKTRLWSSMIDPYAMGLLNRIVEETGALVVVSSVWRYGRGRTELQEILNDAGFEGRVLGVTPRMPEHERGDEIAEWLKSSLRKVESFVILDDDSDMADLKDKLVQTSMETGMLDEHAEKAIRLL